MACILMPECNLMHGYFRCLLPEEPMDMEVKVKIMRGIYTSGETAPPRACHANHGVPDSILSHS